MRDLLPALSAWWRSGESFALATVVDVRGSAPRPPGASMAVSAGGEAVGSVSGGCVEGAVYELGQSVVESGEPVLQRYGISDDDAFAVGLTCGGILDVYVEKISKEILRITSLDEQQLISDFGRDKFGQSLFYPSSAAWKAAHS